MRMTHCSPVRSLTRGLKAVAFLALLGCHASLVAAAPAATVVSIEPTRVADVVLLRGGFDSGLRQGMVCRVTRGSAEIAEILLVELRPAHSAALILNVTPRQSIRAGDVAAIKILKT